jgi:hypothetical protein
MDETRSLAPGLPGMNDENILRRICGEDVARALAELPSVRLDGRH